MCRIYWTPLKYDKRNIRPSCFGQGYSAPRKRRIMLWNCRCTCVFSVFMVSSLVATLRNSLCIFATLSCEGSPRAVATVLGCLCELFSKWKPVTLLQPKRAPCLSRPCHGHDAVTAILVVVFYSAETAKWAFSRWQTWKTMPVLSKPQRYATQRRIPRSPQAPTAASLKAACTI